MHTSTTLPHLYKPVTEQTNHPPPLTDLPVCRYCGESPKIIMIDPRRETKLDAIVCSTRRTLGCTENQFGQILTPVPGQVMTKRDGMFFPVGSEARDVYDAWIEANWSPA